MTDTSMYEMVLAADIPSRLVEDISRAKYRVHLQAMILETLHEMAPVVAEAQAALRRGIKVTLAFDRLSFLDSSRADAKQLKETCSQLSEAGATIMLLGGPLWPLPVAGRSHTKVYTIDDVSYFAGGVNLYEPSFECHDFMLRNVGDDVLLSDLNELTKRQPSDSGDWQMIVDESSKILVDGGRREKSLILDEATEISKGAKQAWYVSQFSPGRQLERQLLRLPHDNLKAWFNTVASSEMRDKPAALIDKFLSKLSNQYKGVRRIHAKFIVVQKADGSYAAITGSHNFSDWGVRFGTKEAALYTTDQLLCKQLIAFAESLD